MLKKKIAIKYFYVKNKKAGNVVFFFFSNIVAFSPSGEIK